MMTSFKKFSLKTNLLLIPGLCLASAGCYSGEKDQEEDKTKNVLFIGIDDLRAEVNSYGFENMHTPNLDRLSEMGMQFNRAYVQQAVSAASRASLLTGCRPITTGVDYPYTEWFNNEFRPEHPTIPVFFDNQGYYTRTLGKVHHGPPDKGLSEKHYRPDIFHFPDKPYLKGKKRREYRDTLNPYSHPDLPDDQFRDGDVARETIETIRRAVKSGKPFFITPGFRKPHLPFVCPKKYYDMYDNDEIELSIHPQLGEDQDPITIRKYGAYNWNNLREKGIDEETARELKHHYYACTSFIDAQVGRLLDELEKLGIMDETIIVLWSDHGYHLGDHEVWGKHSNYELATHSPLMVYNPGMSNSGEKTDALVEYVDMYPTLLDLCGFEIPEWIEGTSFTPVMDNPDVQWKKAAFSQFPRSGGRKEGYTVRTRNFRYTEWRNEAKGGEVFFRELYDHRKDSIEAKNLIDNPAYREVISTHQKILQEGWKEALPPGIENHSNNPRGYNPDQEAFIERESK